MYDKRVNIYLKKNVTQFSKADLDFFLFTKTIHQKTFELHEHIILTNTETPFNRMKTHIFLGQHLLCVEYLASAPGTGVLGPINTWD